MPQEPAAGQPSAAAAPSVADLLEVVRYLRRERQLAEARLDGARLEAQRLRQAELLALAQRDDAAAQLKAVRLVYGAAR